MLTNTAITLYNKYYNRDVGVEEWYRTVINAANWQGNIGVSSRDKGLATTDSVNIYIPMSADFGGKTYIRPNAFARLDSSDVQNYFTFTPDDKIVKGVIDFEIDGIKPNTSAELEKRYDDVVNISSATIWDQGSPSMQHYKIGAI